MKYIVCFMVSLFANGIYAYSENETPVSREEFNNLKATVKSLGMLLESHSVLNKRLESVIEKQNAKIEDLETMVSHYVETARRQEHNISQQAARIRQLETVVTKSTEQNQHIDDLSKNETIVTGAEKRHVQTTSKVKRYAQNTVAFFATVTLTSLNQLGLHQNIVFEDVVTNIGNGYNNHHGVFIAPVSGLYLITTSIRSGPNMEFWAEVVVNGTVIVKLNGRGTDNRHGNGAQTVIIALKKGDDVAVQNDYNVDDFWGDKFSSFGGYLLQELEIDTSSIIG